MQYPVSTPLLMADQADQGPARHLAVESAPFEVRAIRSIEAKTCMRIGKGLLAIAPKSSLSRIDLLPRYAIAPFGHLRSPMPSHIAAHCCGASPWVGSAAHLLTSWSIEVELFCAPVLLCA